MESETNYHPAKVFKNSWKWKKNRDIYEITCLFRSFSIRIKTNNIYKDILEDVEIRFDISNYELDRRLSNEKHKKIIILFKDELREKIMKEFV